MSSQYTYIVDGCSGRLYTLTSYIDFDILSGVVSKGAGVDGNGNFGSPLIAAKGGTHT